MNNPNAADNLKSFKPGHSGNPKGRPPGIDAALRRMTKQERVEFYNRIMHMTRDEVKAYSENSQTPINEGIIARALLKDYLKGEITNYEKLLERVIGRVPQKMEVTGDEGMPFNPPIIQFVPDPGPQKLQTVAPVAAQKQHLPGVEASAPELPEAGCNENVEQTPPIQAPDQDDEDDLPYLRT